jgi:hypothetical protein
MPLHQVRSATITTRRKEKWDLLVLGLTTHEEPSELDAGFGHRSLMPDSDTLHFICSPVLSVEG